MDELQKALALQEGVQPAIDSLNAHDHSGELGNKIPEGGLEDGAVSTIKIQQGAVTTDRLSNLAVTSEKIANGAIGMSKLSSDVQFGGGGALGITNYIAEGLKMNWTDGLSINVNPGVASISDKVQRVSSAQPVSLTANRASLIYAQKNPTGDYPLLGAYDAQFPAADVNTVVRYVFNSKLNDTTIVETTGSGNDLTCNGGLTLVDGWIDKSIQGDGSTGYMVSKNSNGFPTGAAEREIDYLVTPISSAANQWCYIYGASSSYLGCLIDSLRLRIFAVATYLDTGFDMEIGKTYLISVYYDGAILKVSVNGVLIYSYTITLSTGASVLYVCRDNASYYGKQIAHYLELRNKMRTPAQIAAISNKLCLPCHYQGWRSSYPTNPTDTGYHVWKFDDTSGSTVTDEAGTMNGTATGTTIVDSEIGLGKARKANGTTNYISFGNYAIPSALTVILVTKLAQSPTFNYLDIFSCRNGDTNGLLFLYNQNNGTFEVDNNLSGSWATYASPSQVWNYGQQGFAAVTISQSAIQFYFNNNVPFATLPGITLPNVTNPLYFGRDVNNARYMQQGIILNYFAIIPHALSQAEIAQYYNALMRQAERTLVDDCLPANSISLGFSRTNSTALIEYNDTDYKYMRNEGATKSEGNKRVFLGWKYFSGITQLAWNNPLGTRKIKTYYTWAQDANGTNECDTYSFVSGNPSYGIQELNTQSQRIQVVTNSGGVAACNGLQTSGYIGCYVEVL